MSRLHQGGTKYGHVKILLGSQANLVPQGPPFPKISKLSLQCNDKCCLQNWHLFSILKKLFLKHFFIMSEKKIFFVLMKNKDFTKLILIQGLFQPFFEADYLSFFKNFQVFGHIFQVFGHFFQVFGHFFQVFGHFFQVFGHIFQVFKHIFQVSALKYIVLE